MDQYRIYKKTFLIVMRIFVVILFFSTAFPSSAAAYTETAESDFTPWSGWWWPNTASGISTGFNYRGHPAPMEKYELLKDGAYPGPATEWDKNKYYRPDDLSWNGRCEHWSAASVYEHITFFPSSIENLIFFVGDKKGLMVACHSGDNTLRVNSETPDIFHEWLQHYIRDMGVDFYAELDPSIEIWNHPVFKYNMDIQDRGSSLNVTCQIWYVDDKVDEDFQGSKLLTKTYTYTLYKTGGIVTGGEWTGSSVEDHPSILAVPLNQLTYNPYLDCDFAREIAVHRDDELESEEADIINPGKYNLILIDRDDYILDAAKDDEISIRFHQIDEFSENIRITLSDKDKKLVFFTYLSEETETRRFTADNPPYTLSFTRNDYLGGGVYFLQYDLKPAFEFADMKVLKGFGWGGFAITNPGDQTCESIRVTGYDDEGLPIETYIGPFSLEPNQKRTFLVSDLDVRAAERNEMEGVKITAPAALKVVELTGYYSKNMASFSDRRAHQTLVLPDTASQWNSAKAISWGLYNTTQKDASVNMTLYSMNGQTAGNTSFNLQAMQTSHYNKSDSPFGLGIDDGWVLIEAGEGSALKGYVQWLTDGINESEAVSLLVPGREFYASHVIDGSPWKTRLTLINISGENNTLTLNLLSPGQIVEEIIELSPYEKKEIFIADVFPGAGQETINQSALKIISSQNMAGYFAYLTPADDIYYPLLTANDAKQMLTAAHVVENEYWWTGINLFNPSEQSVTFTVHPYDANGNSLSGLQQTLTLSGLQKTALMMKTLFPNAFDSVASVVINVQGNNGLMGIVAYGNHEMTMISGCGL